MAGKLDITALLKRVSAPKPPKLPFPVKRDELDKLFFEMAPSYDPSIATNTPGLRGYKFRFNNNTRGLHGYVRVSDEKPNLLVPLRASKPVYTFPHLAGIDFTAAPNGIYTWVLYEQDEGMAFAATRIENKMEMGTGHKETLVKLGIPKEFKVFFAGELAKTEGLLEINLASGSFMRGYVASIASTYDISASIVNGIVLARAQTWLRSVLEPTGFEIHFDVEAHEKGEPISLISPTTTPLVYNALKEITNVGAARFSFISNSNLAKHGIEKLSGTGRNGLNLPNWQPFLPEETAASGSGSAAASSTRRNRRKLRKITRRIARRH
jgi:hypothetical protein